MRSWLAYILFDKSKAPFDFDKGTSAKEESIHSILAGFQADYNWSNATVLEQLHFMPKKLEEVKLDFDKAGRRATYQIGVTSKSGIPVAFILVRMILVPRTPRLSVNSPKLPSGKWLQKETCMGMATAEIISGWEEEP